MKEIVHCFPLNNFFPLTVEQEKWKTMFCSNIIEIEKRYISYM